MKIHKLAMLGLSCFALAACGQPANPGVTQCTITFVTNGGSEVSPIKVAYGATASKPADPSRAGYTFDAWYADYFLKVTFDWSQSITADWTVYAKWTSGGSSSSEESAESSDISSEDTSEDTSEGTSTPTGSVIYTATDLPSWITDDGCKIFAWAWGGDAGQGAWIDLEYGEGEKPTTASFDAGSQELTGFLLARCQKDTVTPDWQEKGDKAGRVYNKSDDVNCVSGTYSYSCSHWMDA